MSHVLVTGGAGYIGSHVCEALHRAGRTPVVVDDLSRGHGEFVQFGPLAKYRIHETPRLIRTIQEYKIKSVIHLAAFAYVGESVTQPGLYYENNVMGTLGLLKACQESGIENFVFSSSCAVYGNPEFLPLTEDHPKNPINPYGRSKLMCEQMISDYATSCSMSFIALRYFNVAGASSSGKIGEWHDPETHFIPNLLKSALNHQKKTQGSALSEMSLEFYGNDYPTRDGTCIRDYIHVEDLARAHLLSLNSLESKSLQREFINLGAGQGYTLNEILEKTKEVLGSEFPEQLKPVIKPRRQGDPHELVAATQKAESLLGFKPEKNIQDILRTAFQWEKRD